MKKVFYLIFCPVEHAVQKVSTRIAKLIANSKNKRIKNFLINSFIQKFEVNMTEAINDDPFSYKSFNDFFTRALKNNARHINLTSGNIISPVDGTISEAGTIIKSELIQAKNMKFKIEDLLCNKEIGKNYENGKFITIYLAPTDYHRVHMPYSAQLQSMTYVPGNLYPVKPKKVKSVWGIYTLNERLICNFISEIGTFSLVMVGAQLVSGIETVWHGSIKEKKIRTWNFSDKQIVLNRGQEMGRFNFGSTVILCFENTTKLKASASKNRKILLGTAIAERKIMDNT
ncbi:MAG: archaetidylserine decarboxylase [Pseudomonadota bacterium]|nr:archaetidylserine decarboxylase [Pseudomonadota bacterium]